MEERDKYIKIFEKADSEHLGLITSERAKDIFKKSGLSNKILNHIGYLANLERGRYLTLEEFCFIMHLIHLARHGMSIDKVLISNDFMVPLKLRQLKVEKDSVIEEVKDLKHQIFENFKYIKQNEVQKSVLHDKILKNQSIIKDYMASLDMTHQQINTNQSIVCHLKSLLEGYQLKINFSKQQYIKLKNHLDLHDSNFDDLISIANQKKKEIILFTNQLESLRALMLEKYERHEDSNKEKKQNNQIELHILENLKYDGHHDSKGFEGYYSNSTDFSARMLSIKELILTEEVYIQDLSVIVEVFYDAIVKENVFKKSEMDEIFMNIEDIVLCNKNFLRDLQIRTNGNFQNSNGFTIGDVIFEHLQLMDAYIVFCSFQHRRSILLQDKLNSDYRYKEFHRKLCQHQRLSGLSLNSYFLKPMQRITKYPLLIDKILLSTSSEFKDHKFLTDAKSKAIELCNTINEESREQQNTDFLNIIQSRVQCDIGSEKLNFNSETNCLGPRKYLHSGLLYKIRSNKELMGLLFSDFFLLTLPSKYIGQASSILCLEIKPNVYFKAYKNPMLLNEISVSTILEDVTQTSFKIIHKGKIFYLKALSLIERDTWVKKIENASKEYYESEKKCKIRADALKKHLPVGRLLVFVKEGIDLKKADADFIYCEIKMGTHEQKSGLVSACLNPVWNASAQFSLFDIQKDTLHIEIYAKKNFSKNVSLGWAEVAISDISEAVKGAKEPIIKRLLLHEKGSGEVIVKLDLQLYNKQ